MPFSISPMAGINGLMQLTIDNAGRVVIPKSIRDDLQLQGGDTLELEREGEALRLRPVRPKPAMRKKKGIWVYTGDTKGIDIVRVIDEDREARIRSLMNNEELP
jgi:AbrB family looped-hinge helix DNA binding protein